MVMRFGLILGLLLLVGCAPRGTLTMVPAGVSSGEVETVFVGTTRKPEPDGSFGSKRSAETHFARYGISIPLDRELGQINWPPRRGPVDPSKYFLTASALTYAGEPAFRHDIRQALTTRGGTAVVFIHGYNNNFAEGLYRVAQFTHDLQVPGVAVHYAWPSAAAPLGYVYDRDSALFARDGLAELLDELVLAGARQIVLVAHSMGSALTMEALRTAALKGDQAVLQRLSGVILISPDLDVDVFRAQAQTMGKLPQPFIIFGSDRDRMLRISARLTGQKDRLGNLSDLTEIADLDVTFFDVSEFSTGVGHYTLGDSEALILLMNRIGDIDTALSRDRSARIGLLPGAIITVQNATRVVLEPIANAASALQ